jgi:leucyl aminopeptidase
VEVLDEAALTKLGMGLLLAVGRGSSDPPRLIVLRYEPAGAPETPLLGLIGKGVTFDSGGLSLKTPDLMTHMNDDMGARSGRWTSSEARRGKQSKCSTPTLKAG